MAQTSARALALAALKTWRQKKQFADAIISAALETSGLQKADRGFAVDLFYGALRNLTLLDFWICCLRSTRIDTELRDILRLGLYQLFIAGTAEHAAVNETVALAAKRQRSIVNAILRSAARAREELLNKAAAEPLEVRSSHPKFLIGRWNARFGTENTAALCQWNNQPPPIYARINQLKIDRTAYLERYPETRTLSDRLNFVESPPPTAVAAGECYVQDPSTATSCELLMPQPGESVLDACAAPGGKTSYLAQLMQNEGTLIACDRDSDRLRVLNENLARLGARTAKVVQQDWARAPISREILAAAPFDRILVDAPCSNTGVMRRRVDVRWRLRPEEFERMHTRQSEIVRAVLPLLRAGGTLVYSTCSLEREENEDVIRGVTSTGSEMRLEGAKVSLPFRDGFDGAFAAKLRRIT